MQQSWFGYAAAVVVAAFCDTDVKIASRRLITAKGEGKAEHGNLECQWTRALIKRPHCKAICGNPSAAELDLRVISRLARTW